MFVSIKGSSIKWLERAIERGDLLTAWSVAFELPRLPLDHALGLVILSAARADGQPRFNRAALRWSHLYLTGAAGPSLPELRRFVDCLDELPDERAAADLADLCRQRSLRVAEGALRHLTPTGKPSADVPQRDSDCCLARPITGHLRR